MANRRDYIIDVIFGITDNREQAEVIIDRLQEEGVLHLGYGDAEVDAIIDKFTTTYGTTKTSKFDRFAAHRLAQKYGSQAVVGIIGLLAQNAQQKYAPVVNNVSQLEEKWPSILNFLRTVDGEEIDIT